MQPACRLVGRRALPQRDGVGTDAPILWAGDGSSQPHSNPAELRENVTGMTAISTGLPTR